MPNVRAAKPFPEFPPAPGLEVLARTTMAGILAALALSLVYLEAGPASGTWMTLGRIGFLGLSVVAALMIQGARANTSALIFGLVFCFLLMFTINPAAASRPFVLQLIRTDYWLLCAVFLGTWLARGLVTPGDLLAVVLCSAVGNGWIKYFGIAESVAEPHPVHLLGLEWPVLGGKEGLAPGFTDVLLVALFLEAARRFHFNLATTAVGLLAGFGTASVLAPALGPLTASLPLLGLGAFLGAWPAFRCSAQDVYRAFILALILILILLGLTELHKRFNPAPQPKAPQDYYHKLNTA